MNPTNKLRFVERVVNEIKVRILQQWWQPTISLGWGDITVGEGEWRDVPLEEEK